MDLKLEVEVESDTHRSAVHRHVIYIYVYICFFSYRKNAAEISQKIKIVSCWKLTPCFHSFGPSLPNCGFRNIILKNALYQTKLFNLPVTLGFSLQTGLTAFNFRYNLGGTQYQKACTNYLFLKWYSNPVSNCFFCASSHNFGRD